MVPTQSNGQYHGHVISCGLYKSAKNFWYSVTVFVWFIGMYKLQQQTLGSLLFYCRFTSL